MIRNALALALVLVVTAASASAPALAQTDTVSAVRVGDKVRLRAEHGEGRWWVGTVTALSTDTLWIQQHKSPNTLAYRFATIGDLEVSRGRKSNFLPGLGYGALGGGLIFGMFGALSSNDSADSYMGPNALIGAAVGAGLGAVLGGVLGAASHGDRWEVVPLDRADVDLFARYGGGVTLSLTYGL